MARNEVEKYCELKEQAKLINNEVDSLNKLLKAELEGREETNFNFGKYHVYLEPRVTEDFNEAKALDIVLRYWESKGVEYKCPFIRTVEVLDMDALEVAIYKNELPKEVLMELDKCRTKTVNNALKYKIDKEEN